MFPFIAVLTIIGFAAGFILGKHFTEKNLKSKDSNKK